MDGLISEQQQVEEIKKWLHDNSTSLIGGLAIGLALVFGWRFWDGHRQATAQQASVAYTQMINAVTGGQLAAAVPKGEAIITQYGNTSYAGFSALLLARVKAEQGDLAAARAHLQWAVSNVRQPELQQLARLRLARLLLTDNKPDEALKQADSIATGHYVALAAELRGDAYRTKGDQEKARSAYQQALTALDKNQDNLQEALQMKLDAVGGALTQGLAR